MRYVLAIVLVCVFDTGAFAKPATSSHHVSMKHVLVQTGKPKHSASHRGGQADLGGIHPLVGSGAY